MPRTFVGPRSQFGPPYYVTAPNGTVVAGPFHVSEDEARALARRFTEAAFAVYGRKPGDDLGMGRGNGPYYGVAATVHAHPRKGTRGVREYTRRIVRNGPKTRATPQELAEDAWFGSH